MNGKAPSFPQDIVDTWLADLDGRAVDEADLEAAYQALWPADRDQAKAASAAYIAAVRAHRDAPEAAR